MNKWRERKRRREEKAMLAVKSETYTKSEIAADHPRIGDPGIKKIINLGTGGANCYPYLHVGGIHQTRFD